MMSARDRFNKLFRRPTPARSSTAPRVRGEAGETLLEVLISLIILALASVALITAFGADISASAEHRSLSNFDTALASSISMTTTLIQQQYPGVFASCESLSAYPSSSVLTSALNIPNYTAAIQASGALPAVEFTGGTGFTSACTNPTQTTAGNVGEPQLITLVVTDTKTGYSQTDSVVVDDPTPITLSGGSGDSQANQLVFVTQPEGATVGSDFTTQPILEVLDNGQIVTTDLSPITLTLSGGTNGASLSPTCSGIETSGVVVYSGCSINEVGIGYTLTASEPSPTTPGSDLTAPSAPFTVYSAQLATPSVTAIPSTTTAGAINVSFTEAGSPPAGQTYTVKACTNQAMSANCTPDTSITSGNDLTGLVAGTSYWVEVTATSSTSYLASTSPPVGPTMATVQITAPGTPTLAYGTVAGSLLVNFAGSANGPPSGDSYTVEACTNSAMQSNCVSNTNFTPNSNLTGLTVVPGSPGTQYYVQVSANAASGYLASPPSPTTPTVSHAATSEVKTPTGFSTAPSASQGGAITASFSEPGGGLAPSSFSASACTNQGMTSGCVDVNNYTSGAQLTGLTPGTPYYVQITANTSATGYVSASTAVSSATIATVQLATPTGVAVGYGTAAFSLSVNFTPPPVAAAAQTYTVKACTNQGMTNNCVTNTNFTPGTNLTGLATTTGGAGLTYWTQVTANGSSGYLVSPASTPVSQAEESQVGAPGTPSANTSTITGAIVITFANSSGTAPSSYTATACTNQGMTDNCVVANNYTSGAQFIGLTSGTYYYVQITAVGPLGYANNNSSVPFNPTRAR
jgi:type II secretory pathway pseudopilin PulG